MLVQSFSGIRGVFGIDLTEDIARRYVYCYYSFLKNRLKKEPSVVIGTDTRSSNQSLKEIVIDVFSEMIDLGIATTPMAELAVREYKTDGGIMITASHNEPEWNGFKFLDKDGAVLRPDDMAFIIERFDKIKGLEEELFLNEHLYKNVLKNKVKRITKRHDDIQKRYFNFVLKTIGKKKIGLIKKAGLKAVLDPNGGAGVVVGGIFKKAGVKVIEVNSKAGEFNRIIEPNETSLKYLKDAIINNKTDLAAGFDCDADRVELVLANGRVVSGNYVLALAVDDVLSSLKTPEKETVIVNDATSNIIKEIAGKYNAKVEETEAGETNVVDRMLYNKSKIGGEGSSAGVVLPPSRCRDGVITLLLILTIIAKKKKKIDEIIDEYPKYYNTAVKVESGEDYNKVRKAIKGYYSKKLLPIQELGDETGSLKVLVSKKSFVWFRKSKTEGNIIRVIADSDSKNEAERLSREGVRVLRKLP
ncbi:hypothetical protein J4209_04365 [Candidatus Woesearchaeota archaeon]|nr:hypothetical protein [Candidatus Woesearchaeota archaeon]